ncbi:hypothetical protein L7F22_067232 [Adiantum nelumboides]|nr:hypothetical protein [Adiantum nelumboides]
MDQAASIFGVPGHALHIVFVPTLTVQPTKLPSSSPAHAFVVANTLVVSDKKVMGPVQYNLRVAELWMACRALCVHLDLPKDDSTKTLKRLMETYFSKHPLKSDQESETREKYGEEAAKIKVLGALAGDFLPKKGLTRQQVEELTGFKGEAFDKEFLSQFPGESPLPQERYLDCAGFGEG